MNKPKMMTILFALAITLCTVIWQRLSGPTHPIRFKANVDGIELSGKLPRSAIVSHENRITVESSGPILLFLKWRRHNFDREWNTIPMKKTEQHLSAVLPSMMAASKIDYVICDSSGKNLLTPLVLRYRGDVSPWILIPHILIMFFAMYAACHSALAMLMSPNRTSHLWPQTTIVSMTIGGMIFGPLVQKAAFGVYWSGFPFGYDLTDNKTALVLLIWIICYILYCRSDQKKFIIMAALATIIIFSIPHSMAGSELDYSTMQLKK